MIDTTIQFLTLTFMIFQIAINHRSRKIIDDQTELILDLGDRVEALGKLTQIIDQEWKRNECAINMLYLGWQSEEDVKAEIRQ